MKLVKSLVITKNMALSDYLSSGIHCYPNPIRVS